MAELEHYTGNVWTHIISLKREDAERLGYDSATAWRNLLRTHRNDIAAAMNIPPDDFRWYAAFHNEGNHPHVHMMAWSMHPEKAYLSKDGIRKIKSELTNDIFQQELLHIYEQKSESRNELVRQSRKTMLELVREMQRGICDHPEAEQLMIELVTQLETVKGKKSYGYLPKSAKAMVDKIVDQMERLPVVCKCYETWWSLQCQVEDFYSEQERHRPPLSQQKEFRQIKNAIIREAENIRMGKITFEDADLPQMDEQVDDRELSYLCWTLRENIENENYSLEERDEDVEDMESLAEDGDPYAQYFLGKQFRDGPVLTPDWGKARYWFTKSAEQGCAVAQYALGKLLLSDDPEVRDTEQGLMWLERATQGGNTYASYRLGKEYLKGKIVECDNRRGMNYIYTAALGGNSHAQYMLGKLLLQGQVMEQNREAGLEWLNKAAEQGNEYAQFFIAHQNEMRTPSVMLSITRLLHHMSRIFQDHSLPQSSPDGMHIDRKRRQELQEKRIALGHKADDHEDQQYGDWNMSM
jgi:hypothetical protein